MWVLIAIAAVWICILAVSVSASDGSDYNPAPQASGNQHTQTRGTRTCADAAEEGILATNVVIRASCWQDGDTTTPLTCIDAAASLVAAMVGQGTSQNAAENYIQPMYVECHHYLIIG